MLAYLVRRLLLMVLAAILLTYAVWFLTTYDGARALQTLGWNSILPSRYLVWLNNVLHGDLGFSLRTGQPVLQSILNRLPATLLILIPAFILQEFIAVALGLVSAVRYQKALDRIITPVVFIFSSLPPFLFALYTLVLFSVELHWVPFGGLVDFMHVPEFNTPAYWVYFHANTGTAIVDLARHLILPILTLVVVGAAADSQIVRITTLEVLNQEYIRAARARGIPERRVVWRHAFRNALLPLITNIGVHLPRLIFATAIIEYAFGIPGLGKLFIDAVFTPPFQGGLNGGAPAPKDLDIATGYFLVLGDFTLVVSALTDLTYAYADPRIRTGNHGGNSLTTGVAAPSWTWNLPRRAVIKRGRFKVTVGQAGVTLALIAALAITATAVHSVVAPDHPPFSNLDGTWIGLATGSAFAYSGGSGLYLSLSVDQQSGTIRGISSDCNYGTFGGLNHVALSASGYTDGSLIHLRLISATEQYNLHGNFPTTADAFSLTGGFAGTGFNGALANANVTFHHGTQKQWNNLCTHIGS